MNESKKWYLSRTIWGAGVSVAATLGTMFGVPVDQAAQTALTESVLQTVSAVAGIVAIFGRLNAQSRIA